VLDFIERGGHTFIDTQEGTLPEGFAGNITDICPVGALLDNVARFRGRNWEYDHAETVCTLCPVGCSITADARGGALERVVARENREVNEAWICDAGRFGHVFSSTDRLTVPMVRNADGVLEEASWDAAIGAMRAGLAGLNSADLALYISADSTLEEGVAAAAFATLAGTESLDYAPRYPVSLNSQPPTLSELAQADAVIVIGADLEQEAPVVELRIQEMLRGGLLPAEFAHGTAIADLRLVERPARRRERLAVFHSAPTRLGKHAGIVGHDSVLSVLEGLAGTGGSAEVRQAAELLRGAERPVIVVGAEVLNLGEVGLKLLRGLKANGLPVRVLPIPAASNSNGLGHLNLVPAPGGLGYGALNRTRAALISRLDPGQRSAGFTIVHDSHLTATAQLADVVLPAVTGYEKKGTVVNLEGRLLALSQAAIDSGESADLIRTLAAVAEALGVKTRVRGLRSAQTLLQERFGVDFTALPGEGLIAPLGNVYDAPTGPVAPQLWKANMRRSDPVLLPMADLKSAFVAGDD
jgi:NADH-quinone oxidoreductase subunit G